MNVLYLSHSKLKNSVNAVYIKGLVQNGVNIKTYQVKKSFVGYFDAFKKILKIKSDIIIVGYDSPKLVTFCRLFTRKKIIYNALCSVYERLIIARGLYPKLSPHAVYYWLLDFFAISSASLVMLETDSQINYFVKLFKISRKKLVKSWTGVDEDNFFYDPSISKYPVFTVLFRGALMPEAGAEYLIQAAKILENEDIKFVMVSGGLLLDKIKKIVEDLKPQTLEFISDLLSADKLRETMQGSHLSVGQLSDHPRLERTIPHKCYESLAMRLPYLTAANRGVMELLRDGNTCLTCEPANAASFAEKILWAKTNREKLDEIARNGYKLYSTDLTPKVLAGRLVDRIVL